MSTLSPGGEPTVRIVRGPPNPTLVKCGENVTLGWKLTLDSDEPWNKTIREISFGVWDHPGYLKKKLIVINNMKQVSTRPRYEEKIFWDGNLTLLWAAFKIQHVKQEDAKMYGIHVELGLHRNPVTHAVQLFVVGT